MQLSDSEVEAVIEKLISLGSILDAEFGETYDAIVVLRKSTIEDAKAVFYEIYINRQLIEALGDRSGELSGKKGFPKWRWQRRGVGLKKSK